MQNVKRIFLGIVALLSVLTLVVALAGCQINVSNNGDNSTNNNGTVSDVVNDNGVSSGLGDGSVNSGNSNINDNNSFKVGEDVVIDMGELDDDIVTSKNTATSSNKVENTTTSKVNTTVTSKPATTTSKPETTTSKPNDGWTGDYIIK